MKIYRPSKYLLAAILSLILVSSATYAQLGWKWGKRGHAIHTSWGRGVEGSTTAVDKFGGIYQTILNEQWGSYAIDTFLISNPHHYVQLVIMKLDSSGAFKWAIATSDSTSFTLPLSSCTDAAGNSYVLGTYSGTVMGIQTERLTNPTFPAAMCFLTKISSTGHVLWAKNVCQNSYRSEGGIGLDDSGNIYISRQFDSATITLGSTTIHNYDASGTTSDIFFAKYDSSGNCRWAKRLSGNKTDYSDALTVTGDGNVYLAGRFESDTFSIDSFNVPRDAPLGYRVSFIAKFDRNGTPLFAERISPHVAINSIAVDRFQNLYTAGSIDGTVILGADTLTNVGIQNAFAAKYSSLGNVIWARSGGGTQYDNAFWVSMDYCGKVWVSGSMAGVTYVPGSTYSMNFSGTILNTPASSYDPMFVIEYDTSGNMLSNMTMPSGGDDRCAIALDNAGNAYFGGDYWNTNIAFGPDTLVADSTFEEFFVARFRYDTTICDCATVPAASFTHTGYGFINFTYTGTSVYDSIVWNFGDGITSHTVNPSHSYSMGAYSPCVTIYTHCAPGGSITACDTIFIHESVSDPLQTQQVYFAPNPTAHTTTLYSDEAFTSDSKLQLFDMTGRCVGSYLLSGKRSIIALGDMPVGVYQCRISTANGQTIWKKLMVTQ